MQDRLTKLHQWLSPLADYPWHSRCHALNSLGPNVYIKRDDELGVLACGSKLRKYLSLLPSLHDTCTVILIGSAYSNHILQFTPLLIQNGIQPHLFLLGQKNMAVQGNLLFTQLYLEQQQVHWVSRNDWPRVMDIAIEYSQQLAGKVKIIPEGAFMAESLAGAITLALDIIRNEQQYSLTYDHVFLDAGSGMLAIATLLAFAWLGKKSWLHILLLADDEATFMAKLTVMAKHFNQLTGMSHVLPQCFSLHRPKQARAFGSHNQQVWQTIKRYARNEGILLDPIYSAKLFIAVEDLLQQGSITGNCLCIHSGGSFSLAGFQSQLSCSLR